MEWHPGDDVLQIEVRVSLYDRTLRGTWCNGWEAGLKTFSEQVGIQGQENRKIPLLWSG